MTLWLLQIDIFYGIGEQQGNNYDSRTTKFCDDLGLTHWGQVTHICVSDLTIIGSDNGLSPGRRQAIIRTSAEILLVRPLGTNFSEVLFDILIFSFKKMRLKMLSAKRWPFCLGLNVFTHSVTPYEWIVIIIGSHCGFSPIWHHAIMWTNADIMPRGPLGGNLSEI